MKEQLDFLGAAAPSNHITIEAISSIEVPTNSIIGLSVRIERVVKCGHSNCRKVAIIGPGNLHHGSLRCERCGKHLGWLSKQSHDFVSETQRLFGRPTDPIVVRKRSG